MQLEISQRAYDILVHAAQERATTPEALVETLAESLSTSPVAQNEIEFYHALGFDDAAISEVMEMAQILPRLEPGNRLSEQDLNEG